MHHRLRMVAASFLVKDIGIDWRQGGLQHDEALARTLQHYAIVKE